MCYRGTGTKFRLSYRSPRSQFWRSRLYGREEWKNKIELRHSSIFAEPFAEFEIVIKGHKRSVCIWVGKKFMEMLDSKTRKSRPPRPDRYSAPARSAKLWGAIVLLLRLGVLDHLLGVASVVYCSQVAISVFHQMNLNIAVVDQVIVADGLVIFQRLEHIGLNVELLPGYSLKQGCERLLHLLNCVHLVHLQLKNLLLDVVLHAEILRYANEDDNLGGLLFHPELFPEQRSPLLQIIVKVG